MPEMPRSRRMSLACALIGMTALIVMPTGVNFAVNGSLVFVSLTMFVFMPESK